MNGNLLAKAVAGAPAYFAGPKRVVPDNCLNLSRGQIGIDVPYWIREVFSEAARGFYHGYGAKGGDPKLLSALKCHFGLADLDRDCVVTAGAKEGIFCSMLNLAAGRLVVVPEVGWPVFRLLSGIFAQETLLYDVTRLETLIQRVRQSHDRGFGACVVLNFPHNPTGVDITATDLSALLEVFDRKRDTVIFDGVYLSYSKFLTVERVTRLFCTLLDRWAVVHSSSKWLGLAGLRLGFVVADETTTTDVVNTQALYASHTSALSQECLSLVLGDVRLLKWEQSLQVLALRQTASLMDLAIQTGHRATSGGIYVWLPELEGDIVNLGDAKIAGVGAVEFGGAMGLRLCPMITDRNLW